MSSEKIGVFLCTCGKELSKHIDFKKIRKGIKGLEGVKIIETVDLLCKDEGLPYITQYVRWDDKRKLRKIVIGACSPKAIGGLFLKLLEKHGLKGDSLEIVNLEDCKSLQNKKEATEKAKILVERGIERIRTMAERPEILEVDLEGCANQPLTSKKLGVKGCSFCIDACPYGAIFFDGKMIFNEYACRGCSLCVAACPLGVIQLKGYEDENLAIKMEALLTAESKVLTFSCKGCLSSSKYPSISIPCFGRIDEIHLLKAFYLGADTVLLDRKGKCALETGFKEARRKIALARDILKAFGIEAHIRMTGRDIETHRSTKLRGEKSLESGEGKRDAMIKLLHGYSEKLNMKPKLIVEDEKLPFGMVKISEDCTACNACAMNCNSGALEMEGENVAFTHAYCIGCGICAEICPEKAIKIEKTFDLSRFIDLSKEIFEPELAKCTNCGKAFMSAKALQRISEMLREQAKDKAELEKRLVFLKLCPECKYLTFFECK